MRSTNTRRLRGRKGLIFALVLIYLVCAVATLAFLLTGQGPLGFLSPPGPTLPVQDVQATAEAYTFATAQANRQETRESVSATHTSLALASVTVQAEASGTALAHANSTTTAAVKATAEAPPTLTAIANRHLEDEARAEATVHAVEVSAVSAFGPSGGVLNHNGNDSPVCEDTGLQLNNFIVQARFYNPYATFEHGWDYGFRFTNFSRDADSDNSYYDVALDSSEYLSLRLGAPGFYVQEQDTTFDHIDLSANGSNLLKVYFLGNEAHVYINDRYSATLDLHSVDLGGDVMPGPRSLAICTGLKDADMQQGASTRYEDFTVWKLP